MVVREQLLGFACGEAEVDGSDLGQVAGGAKPAQSQSGVRAGDEHQVRLSRQVRDQELDLLVTGRLLDEVEVVEDEDEVVRSGCQSAHDGREQGPRGRFGVRSDDAGRLTDGEDAAGAFQGRGDVGPQPIGVVVAAVEGDPRSGLSGPAVQPLRDDGGLAVARRGHHESDPMAGGAIHRLDQAISLDPAVAVGRGGELGIQERVDRGWRRDRMPERIRRLTRRHRCLAHTGVWAPNRTIRSSTLVDVPQPRGGSDRRSAVHARTLVAACAGNVVEW